MSFGSRLKSQNKNGVWNEEWAWTRLGRGALAD
jgi:hypothetical protein